MRTIVIGDCHGQPHLIENALRHSDFDRKQDRLVFAGDLVDIGYQEDICLKLLLENDATILMGNHDVAMILGQYVHPQNGSRDVGFEKWYERIDKYVAVAVDGVLVTHAGLSFEAHHDIFGDDRPGVGEIARKLNHCDIRRLYRCYHGPLWYRPTKAKLWYNGFKQVAGHTPVRYAENLVKPLSLVGFYMVDPYYPGWSRKSFRYAEIVDGNVEVFSK